MVGSFRAQHFQKSIRKFQELPRKWFHFKPLTPTYPGGAVLRDTGREGRREEGGGRQEGRLEGGVREMEGRKLREGGGR